MSIPAWLKQIITATCVFFCLSGSALAEEASKFNMTPGITPISKDMYWLHMTILWICVIIGVLVFGVMIYALIKHRKSAGHKAEQFHSSTKIEILWAVIPFFILVGMAVPATIVLVRMEDTGKADLNIKVTGYQWKWKYEYLDQGISFFSNLSTPQAQLHGTEKKGQYYLLEVDNPLVVPIHKKIRFLVTANDVIHAWWVPALGVKRDAIPGFIHESWARIEKPGIYRGQCAELCGLNHGYMPIVVIAKTQEDFDKWVAEKNNPAAATTPVAPTAPAQPGQAPQPPTQAAPPATKTTMTKDELMTLGEKTYVQTCAVCHKADGTGMPPAFPAMKGSKIAIGPADAHMNIVINGKPGTAMQAFGEQLSDQEIAAVITYERNSWGNAASIVQPTDVAAAKKK